MQSDDAPIQNAAAEAAGNLGGAKAVPQLGGLVSSPDEQTRLAAANGLGNTHARQAVPVLIALLIDSEASVRQGAVSGLRLLTHRVASEGDPLADVMSPQSAAAVHLRWLRWWNSYGKDSEVHGMADCAPSVSLD
jgi:HEAT repeat protein